jgi:fucose permease
MLPMPFILIPLSRQTPKLAARIGFAFVGSIGLVLMAIGFLVFSRLSTDFSYWYFLAGLVPFAAGMACAGPPATTAIIASALAAGRLDWPLENKLASRENPLA